MIKEGPLDTGSIDPENEEERSFEAAEQFLEVNQSGELRGKWDEDYRKSPDLFFSSDNEEHLRKLPAGERLILLAYTLHDLRIKPDAISEYFETFPRDIQTAKTLFGMQGGLPETVSEHDLFAVTVPFFAEEVKGSLTDRQLDQYLEIAERRKLAPGHLIEGFTPGLGENLKRFERAAGGFLSAWDKAVELDIRGDYFIDPKQMFTPEYQALIPEQQAELLRIYLSHLQSALVFSEVYNSVFTRESVERRERLSADNEKGWGGGYNVAHSMLFGTRQPESSFNAPQDYFEWEMGNTADIGGNVEEYPFERLLIAVLHEFQDIDIDQDINTDLLIDFWSKNRNPLFASATTDALSAQNPQRAAGKLLERIRGESRDKRSLAVILYRLELGQIGISEEGVQYLERLYDLGEHNNPDFFVRRLSGEGEIGVFDDNRELLGYFELGDITDGQKNIRAEVLELTYEMLFMPREDESGEDRADREQFLEEFSKKYFSFYDDEFFQKTRVHFNNLPLHEQGWFMRFVENADEEKKKQALDFVRRYGENGMRTFLSLEHGEEMGETILSLGDGAFPESTTQLVCDTYARIVDASRSVAQYVSTQFEGERVEASTVGKITEKLLLKGKELLTDFSNEKGELRGEAAQKEVVGRLMDRLRGLREEILLFGATFKEVSKEHKIGLEDIEGAEIVSASGGKLTKEIKKEMVQFFIENRKGAFPDDLLERNTEIFKNQLEDSEARFYILKYEGKLASFIRFQDVGDGSVEATSLNAPPYARGLALGTALFAATLEHEGSARAITGTVLAENTSVLESYKKLGFEITGERTVRTEGGNEYQYIDLARPPRVAS